MSNIYKGLGLYYFQLPEDMLSKLPEMNGNALALYVLIMARAQRKSTPVVELTSREIRAVTGMGPNGVTLAAEQLADLGLVHLTRRKGAQWGMRFEVLDPSTGLPIPTLYARKLDAGKLTIDQQRSYALHRLGELFSHFGADGNILANCPFHYSPNPKPRLSIRAGHAGLMWNCREEKCPHTDGGSIIDFEVALSRERGEQINTTIAWERIVFVIKAAERKDLLEAQAVEDAAVDMEAVA